jgi:hypothetical protein
MGLSLYARGQELWPHASGKSEKSEGPSVAAGPNGFVCP